MTEKDYVVLLDLRVKPETHKQIEELAHRRGYDTLDEYVRALIVSDAVALGELLDLDNEGDPIEDFRQGWKDAITGKTLPASALWDISSTLHMTTDNLFSRLGENYQKLSEFLNIGLTR